MKRGRRDKRETFEERRERIKKRRPPVSPESLHSRALWYLERFETSVANMRRYLQKKVKEAIRDDDPVDWEDATAWIEDELARLQRVQLLDDGRYANVRAGSLHWRGKASRAIRLDLRRKGIDDERIVAALAQRSDDEDLDPELEAACRLARRKRLGPYYRGDDRKERRQRHMGALARAGFNYDIGRKVLDAETVEQLEDLLHQR